MIKIEPIDLNGLKKNTSADCFQVRSVSVNRFIEKIGVVSLETREAIKIGLKKVLTIQ